MQGHKIFVLNNVVHARWLTVLEHFLTRGLGESTENSIKV